MKFQLSPHPKILAIDVYITYLDRIRANFHCFLIEITTKKKTIDKTCKEQPVFFPIIHENLSNSSCPRIQAPVLNQ